MSILTGSATCIKNVLFAYNMVFMITGIVLIAVGVGVNTVYSEYKDFLSTRFFSIPTFLIVIGSFVIVISLFGCWGALKENYCLILSFSVLLGLIFILELSAGICGYVLRTDAEDLIRTSLQTQIKQYDKDTSTTKLWDYVQRKFACCGIDNYTDWSSVLNDGFLPASCCTIPDGTYKPFSCTVYPEDTNRNIYGCLTEFSDFVRDHAVSLGAVGIVIAILQFAGVLFAGYIAREIKIRNGITGCI